MTVIEELNAREKEISAIAKEKNIHVSQIEQYAIINNIYLKSIIAYMCSKDKINYNEFLDISER